MVVTVELRARAPRSLANCVGTTLSELALALRAVDRRRIPEPVDSDRGGALPAGGRVRRTLPRRTESPVADRL